MSSEGANVTPGNGKKPKKGRSQQAAAVAAEVIEAGLPLVVDADADHRKAVTEALAQSALKHMLEHRGTALRLRKLLSTNLSEVERVIEALPDSAALVGHLTTLEPMQRQAVYHAVGLPGRIEAVDRLVGTFAKLVAVDKELLGLPDAPPAEEATADHSALTAAEQAQLERIRTKFAHLRRPKGDVTDVEAK